MEMSLTSKKFFKKLLPFFFLVISASELIAQSGKIVYATHRDGNFEIYIMDSDGTNKTRLTNNSVYDDRPSLSADGNKIAFMRSVTGGSQEIFTMNVDGSNQTNLTNHYSDDYDPCWSPDGNKIVFFSNRDGDYEIYVMNNDGANIVKLTDNTFEDRYPAFSPDGAKIAFESKRDGLQDEYYEIYVINSDGTNEVRLTNNAFRDHCPDWSHDGSKIVFYADRGNDYQIYVMNSDGSNQNNITNSYDNLYPTWSPDGSKIAYTSIRSGYDIYKMNPDGSNQEQLTTDGDSNIWPSWERPANDVTPPSTITDLYVSAVTATSATLTWTAPGDDGSTGTATTYDIRYSTSSISETNWASADQAQNEPTPQAAGSAETFTVSGLSQNTTYYFAIKSADEVPNWSGISNLARYDKFSEFIHVRAKIDGSDWFEMTNNTWRWQHRNNDVPERHNGIDSTEVNNQKFLSDWPSGTSSGSYSAYNTVTGLQSLQTQFGANVEVSLEVIDSQGPVTLEQIPTSLNNYTFRIFLNDDDYGSHYFYEFRLWAREGISPSNTTDLALNTVSTSSVTLTWTSPGDDTTWGTASSYDIRYSTSNITEANWSSAQTTTGEPSPQAAGNTETFTVSNLTQNILYYFALKTGDEVPNWSALSNVLSTKTGTPVSGNQSGAGTVAESPYIVIGDVTVPAGETLTLEAGVEVRFNGNYSVFINGSMLANGTASNHIKFTSNKGTPSAGDWGNIYISGSSAVSKFDYCDFEYGGNASSGQILYFYQAGSNDTLNHCTISNSADRGVTVHAWSYPTFNYCTISNNNGFGIYNLAGMKLRNSTVTNNGNYGVRTAMVTDWQPSDYGTDSDPGMNTFKDNTGYDIWHYQSADLPEKYNYWGTEDADTIASHIHQDGSGAILYQPFIKYSDTNPASTGSAISFNESGDGHGIDMNFSSLTGSGDVTVRQTNEQPSDAPSFNAFGHYLTIEIDESITSFSTDITFHYTDADATGYTESNAFFGIAKFNSSTNTWQWLGGTVDANNNTVTVSGVTSFSTFALFRRIFGDITGDGYVDAADLQRLGDCWHSTNSGEFTAGSDARFFNYNKNTDASNQIIDAADLQVFGDCWHNGVAP